LLNEGFAARLPPVQSGNNFTPSLLFQKSGKSSSRLGGLLRISFPDMDRRLPASCSA